MKSSSKLFVGLFLLALVTALVALPAAAQKPTPVPPQPPPQATPEAAASPQLVIDVNPVLGMQVLSSLNAPDYFSGQTLGGGDIFMDAGGDCAAGYTASIASLGMVWVYDFGPVRIGFASTNPNQSVALILWEALAEQWWCNLGYEPDNYLEFTNLATGMYYVWVMTEQPSLVPGEMYVTAYEPA